jgi:acetyl esterase/lipase
MAWNHLSGPSGIKPVNSEKQFAGDGMRTRSIVLLLAVLICLPVWASPQHDGAATGKDAEGTKITQSDSKKDSDLEKENWGALNDLKTGLQPPSYSEFARDEQPEFVRQVVRVQWRAHDPIDLWVIRPKVNGNVPVVLYLYGNYDNGDRFRDNGWCKRATAGGFAAVGFVSDLTDYRFRFRPLRQWFVSELAESIGSTVHDVQFILNYLAVRGDMDMDRVGMFGMGSGATIAILSAQADPRIKTLDLLDPWGDWPTWLKQSPLVGEDERSKFLTPEFLKSVSTLDPVAYLPSLKTQHIRLQQTLSEPETPKAAKDRIAAAVPDPSQLAQYASPMDMLKSWQTTGLSGWMKQQMRPHTLRKGSDDGRIALEEQGIGANR